MFKIQNIKHNTVNAVDQDNLKHVLSTTSNITKVSERNDSYDLIRGHITVRLPIEVETCGTECKKKRLASMRVEVSLPVDVTETGRDQFEKQVLNVGVNSILKLHKNGFTKGFRPDINDLALPTSVATATAAV